MLAAVSPAVVVPSVLALQDKGYGTRKGVPTLIVAAASCENVFAIAAFGVALGITFSGGKYLRGPVVMGQICHSRGILIWKKSRKFNSLKYVMGIYKFVSKFK